MISKKVSAQRYIYFCSPIYIYGSVVNRDNFYWALQQTLFKYFQKIDTDKSLKSQAKPAHLIYILAFTKCGCLL